MKVSFNEQISLSTLLYALLAMFVCFLPHIMDAAWIVLLMAVFALSYRIYATFYHLPQLSGIVKVALVALCLALLRWHYGVLFSSAVLIDFLLMFYWLKVIEVYRRRDLRLLMLSSMFVMFTVLLRHAELWVFPYVLLALFLNLLFMLQVDSPHLALRVFSKISGRLLVVALPLSMILFFLFPRMLGPLWHMPDFNKAKTGFSEVLKPGEMFALAQDFSPAFRVQYHGNLPQNSYWRGLTLSAYDGVAWRQAYSSTPWTLLPLLSHPSDGMVEILLEPHQSRWLFYQDEPVAGSPSLLYSSDAGLTREGGGLVDSRLTYALNFKTAIYRPISSLQFKYNTLTPQVANPKLRAWAQQQFIAQGQDVTRFVAYIRDYINQNPYWYRLNPSPIGQDMQQLDRFWFTSREGYCETYASAAAFILRAAGIPARVVLGYYGGEWNPLAGYLTLRQADAHAWIEYWLEGKGWQRFDPTAAINKQRIDENLSQRLAQFANQGQQWTLSSGEISWLLKARMTWDAFSYGLERWLLFYNETSQQSLLQSLGLSWGQRELISAFFYGLLAIFFGAGAYLWWQSCKIDPIARARLRFNAVLKQLNMTFLPSMSLYALCCHLAIKYPSLSKAIFLHYEQYELLRLKAAEDSKIAQTSTVILLDSLRALLKKKTQ